MSVNPHPELEEALDSHLVLKTFAAYAWTFPVVSLTVETVGSWSSVHPVPV